VALGTSEIKYLVSLNTKKGRRQENRFLAEGVRLLEEALSADYMPLTIFYAPSEINSRGEKLVKSFVKHKVKAQSISGRECSRLSDTKSSQGIIALFDREKYSLEQQLRKNHRKVLICDRIGDPGNLGTLIRSAVAFDFDLVITTVGSAETINPKTIRASMGGFFRIPIVEGVNDIALAGQLKKLGYKIYEADVKGKLISRSMPIAVNAALVIGSEAAGTGPVLGAEAHYRIRIPMSKKTESLNSAMAGTVLMFWFNSPERIKR
jgi:TrmH family RNA methyltransferase